jgi:hypothetical protein
MPDEGVVRSERRNRYWQKIERRAWTVATVGPL